MFLPTEEAVMSKTSVNADIAAAIGVLAALAVVAGPAGVHLRLFSPIRGLVTFSIGLLPGALLAFCFGVAGYFCTRRASQRSGRGRAWLGMTIGTMLLLLAGFLVVRARHTPPIHDLSTNPADPPAFSDAVRAERDRQNSVDYPNGGLSVPAMQAQAYPDLAPIALPLSAELTLDRARRAAEQLGWKITRVDPTEGRIEAYDVSRFFMFVDDVVVRVRAATGTNSIVDVRSSSRIGVGDLGKNAARVRAFREAVLAMR
jgi:uncharacterized protein (DUF1499 family)